MYAVAGPDGCKTAAGVALRLLAATCELDTLQHDTSLALLAWLVLCGLCKLVDS